MKVLHLAPGKLSRSITLDSPGPYSERTNSRGGLRLIPLHRRRDLHLTLDVPSVMGSSLWPHPRCLQADNLPSPALVDTLIDASAKPWRRPHRAPAWGGPPEAFRLPFTADSPDPRRRGTECAARAATRGGGFGPWPVPGRDPFPRRRVL